MSIKILSTVGPSTQQKVQIYELLKYSDILRTNGSHNNIKWHENISNIIKSINKDSIHLLDIPGVKPRTKNDKLITIKFKEKICFYYKKNFKKKLNIKNIELTKSLPSLDKNKKIFSVCDGQYTFDVIELNKNYIIGRSNSNFELQPRKGLNIPGSIYDDRLQLSSYKNFLTKSKNIKFDAIGLSYVQSKHTIQNIKKIYEKKIIISKIENLEGLKNIKEIVRFSDVIMIDRGDLAAEVGNHNLFESVIQITEETKIQGKPLIIATENLSSMINKNEPTKSEIISLGFNFFLDSDYIMLSEETSISSNWLNTVKWLYNFKNNSNIINQNKKNYDQDIDNNNENNFWPSLKLNLDDNVIFISSTGSSVNEFKKKYPFNKCFIFTDSLKTKNLCKFWKKIIPIYFKSIRKFNDEKNILNEIKKNKNIVFNPDSKKIIVVLNQKNISRGKYIYIFNRKDVC